MPLVSFAVEKKEVEHPFLVKDQISVIANSDNVTREYHRDVIIIVLSDKEVTWKKA